MLRTLAGRLVALTVGACLSAAAGATAKRTFVASNGVDSGSCSIAAPCRGFAAALAQTSAGGEVIVLDSAGYGAVTITQSVSIIAPAGVYAGISVFTGDGITVNAPGATVVLRGLSINGLGGNNGVNLLQAARLRIESCVISKMNVDGVMHSAAGAELIVLDTIVRDNGASGIGGDADASVVLDHVRSEHNQTNGFYLAAVSATAHATITDSVFAFNGANGIWVAATGSSNAHALVERSVMTNNNLTGLKISGTAGGSYVTVAATRNAINENSSEGALVTGAGFMRGMFSENTIHGNFKGISTDGASTVITASANDIFSYTADLSQANGAVFYTYNNNTGPTFFANGTVTPKMGN